MIMEVMRMSITDKFGSAVGNMSLENSEKARKLLLTGYRLQEKRLLIFPDRGLPASGQYAARLVMQRIIQALEKPESAAMVSIFVPGELLTAAGLTPYSVEALSCFMAGTKCEQTFLRKTEEEGFPETMCSYHRVFLGAALTGLLPKPKCMVYTNLACDGNMMTFPYLKETYDIPGFYIDVPYEKNKDSVVYVAEQLRELKHFLEEVTGKNISEEAVCQAVANSREQLHPWNLLQKTVIPSTVPVLTCPEKTMVEAPLFPNTTFRPPFLLIPSTVWILELLIL